MRQKTAQLYLCNNFVKTFYSEMIIGTYTPINLKQNDIKIANLS